MNPGRSATCTHITIIALYNSNLFYVRIPQQDDRTLKRIKNPAQHPVFYAKL